MRLLLRVLALCTSFIFFLLPAGMIVLGSGPVVHSVLFYSPTCPHCHKVITEDLTQLVDQYGESLFILAINTYTEEGQELYQATVEHFQVADERRGVPMLVVGNEVLVGSYEIPMLFPGIIRFGLAAGGIAWPEIPGLDELLEEQVNPAPEEAPDEQQVEPVQPEMEAEENPSANYSNDDLEQTEVNQIKDRTDTAGGLAAAISTTESMTISERFMQDKIGNTLSTILLIGMILSVIWLGIVVLQSRQLYFRWPKGTIPLLILIGLVVALYMGFVEITQSEAVCGPVGDCNTVQQSSYAYLFGSLPMGTFGLVGYLLMGFIWFMVLYGPSNWRQLGTWSLWGLALFGTLFSIYLTFLEPFVIGATCAWCLTSAIVMTLLLWTSTSFLTGFTRKQATKFSGNPF